MALNKSEVVAAVATIDAEPFRQSSKDGLLIRRHEVLSPGSIGAEQLVEQVTIVNRELLDLIDLAEKRPVSIVR